MTMSPHVRRHNDTDLEQNTTIDHSGTFGGTTNPNTQYNSHAKISHRNHKKNSVEHVGHHQMSAVLPDNTTAYDSQALPDVKGA